MNNTLFLIPARGGSKGIPHKNSKPLAGKPLIHYSIEYARLFADDTAICLSTDDASIIACAEEIGLKVPFVRPDELATDTSSSFAVMHHAIEFFKAQGQQYERLVLLQPTSPFREEAHLTDAFALFDEQTDVVVSVVESANNPYYNLFEENDEAFLQVSKGTGSYTRRQDCPPVYQFNGSIYVFSVEALLKANSFKDFSKVKKCVMDNRFSLDLDTPFDWELAEFLISRKPKG